MLMAKALSQPHSSLLVQDILASDSGIIKVNEPSCTSIFCQNSNEGSIGQLLWRDNNKQAVVIAPKQRVDLKRWTLFMMAADHPSNSHPRESAQQASENGFPSAKSEVSTTITVLLEASYREQEDNELLDCYVMVEQLSQPYAWKARDVFGVIVTTTPPQLLAMIQAFFNNALIVDDDFLITKIITVDLVGQPSTFDDPLSIPESVTPGPWTTERATCTQMELARSVSPTNFNGLRETASSNPNLQRCGSPFVRGVTHSSSFTSSPFRRPHSSTAVFSPAKRVISSVSGLSPPGESSPGMPLMRVEEEGPCRKNLDVDTGKPPNVLVYAANKADYFEAVRDTLVNCLNQDRYTVYQLTDEMAFKSPWAGSTTLLVVCGDVPAHVSTVFIRYLLQGGRVLSICSDFLNVAVPLFGTVEVQEQAVVSISYRRWSSVQLLHHQHCFHSSPRHKRFSQDLEKTSKKVSRSAVSVEPTHVEITDECGGQHRLNLSILATDDTWGAPSLLSARLHGGNGKAVFSQVHLERDPQECFGASNVPSKLSVSNEARLEILRDLLNSELSMDTTSSSSSCVYTAAYFLGRHELKQDLLNRLQPHLENQELKRPQLTLQFVNAREIAKQADEDLLPLLMNACPMTFSTVRYFETLKTTSIGRLVIYCDVMTTSMKVTAGHPPLIHGITVVPTQQTQGKGRSGNAWLSPLGCAMFTTQLHIPLSSNLGQHLPFLQHLVAIAIVQAVREYPGYGDIPLNLKWPNDIYIAGDTKVGGVIVEATTIGKEVIANVGCGINLSNSNPTYCINDAVRQHNKEHKTSLPEIDRETFLARIFNHFEGLIDTFQKDGPEAVCPIYYKYWLHSNAVVTVQNENRSTENAVITGVDNYGFLIAHLVDGTMITLQPDGNSFDMMEGLIYSKLQ